MVTAQSTTSVGQFNIDSFLFNPFDLYKFKKTEGGSNSGGAQRKQYYYQPVYKGIYYSFFLFPSGEYLADRKDKRLYSREGLEITTYKPLGKYRGDYLDPTEELIEFSARSNNINIPELAFVGMDSSYVTKKLGSRYTIKNNCCIYLHKDRVLVLGLQARTIVWLKYIHLNQAYTLDKFPNEVLTKP